MDRTVFEPVHVSTATKDCPTCSKELEANAENCPACGAGFEVYTRAYCTHCHKLIHTTADGKCPECQGSDLLDLRLFSTLIAAGTLTARPADEIIAESAPVEKPTPPAETKKCPRCAETIKAEARLCRFCGARFEVAVKGYCTNCHAEVMLDENDHCLRCGGEVVDRHISSTLVGAAVPAPLPVAAAPVPASPAPAVGTSAYVQTAVSAVTTAPGYTAPVTKVRMPFWQLYFSPKGRIGRLTFFLKGILVLIGVFFLLGLVLGLISGLASTSANQEEITNVSAGILVLTMLPLSWVWLMLMVKRLHDMNRSGWNVLVILIPFVGQLLYLGLLIACFFVKGSGPNRYGDTVD